MVIGVLGHAARFAAYAFFPDYQMLIIVIQVLHGVCYAFFFATVYIFVDAYFPKDARSSAQGLFNLMILGIGALAANSICPFLFDKVFTENDVTDFHGLFMVPLACASVAAVVLAICFRPPDVSVSEALDEEPGEGEGTGQAEYVLPDDSDIDDDDRYAAYEMDDPEDEHDEAGQ